MVLCVASVSLYYDRVLQRQQAKSVTKPRRGVVRPLPYVIQHICTCGFEFPFDAIFCHKCGAQRQRVIQVPRVPDPDHFKPAPRLASTPTKICICGASVNPGAPSCWGCGRQFQGRDVLVDACYTTGEAAPEISIEVGDAHGNTRLQDFNVRDEFHSGARSPSKSGTSQVSPQARRGERADDAIGSEDSGRADDGDNLSCASSDTWIIDKVFSVGGENVAPQHAGPEPFAAEHVDSKYAAAIPGNDVGGRDVGATPDVSQEWERKLSAPLSSWTRGHMMPHPGAPIPRVRTRRHGGRGQYPGCAEHVLDTNAPFSSAVVCSDSGHAGLRLPRPPTDLQLQGQRPPTDSQLQHNALELGIVGDGMPNSPGRDVQRSHRRREHAVAGRDRELVTRGGSYSVIAEKKPMSVRRARAGDSLPVEAIW